MENKKGKTRVNESKNVRFVILLLVIILGLVFLAKFVTSTGIRSYLNKDYEVLNISVFDLAKVKEDMTYKDIIVTLGKTKDVGENEYVALYKIDDLDYLYLTFSDFNEKANLNKTKLEAQIVRVSMNNLGSLYLEIKTTEESKKIKIIDDYETLKIVLNIFDENQKEEKEASVKVSPTYYLKATFNVSKVGIVYLNNYKLWLDKDEEKSIVQKENEKPYYISEVDTKILKEIFLGA